MLAVPLPHPPESHGNLVVTRDRASLDEATALIDKLAQREAFRPALGIVDRAVVQRKASAAQTRKRTRPTLIFDKAGPLFHS